MAHAILSPSAASRWLTCTPSARLEQGFADTTSEAAAEGTLAHTIGEIMISKAAKFIAPSAYKRELALAQKNSLYSPEMLEYCEQYAAIVLERYSEALSRTPDALLLLEQKLDLTHIVPEGFGTADVQIIADGVLEIIDLKYGKGVPVSAVGNKQLRLYGLGAYHAASILYDIHTVRMTIVQPRLDSVTTDEISVTDLLAFGTEASIKAQLAFKGEGEFVPGEHCRFCKAKPQCRALAEYNLQLAQHDFKDPALLTPEETSDVLTRADFFTKWISAVEDYALDQAVNHGAKWPGYKVVEGRSNRTYSDEAQVANKLQAHGLTDDKIYTRKLQGVTAIEKELGKTTFNSLLGPLVIKPAGKPTLVPESDKRPEYHSNDAAAKAFDEALTEDLM